MKMRIGIRIMIAAMTIIMLVVMMANAATTNNGSAGYDFASCTRNVAIPKFATVALPAVSVLCLFLYFNRRERNFKGV